MPTFDAQALPRLWSATGSLISTVKDPLTIENFTVDWSAVLSGDTIASSTWDVATDLGVASSSFANTVNPITGVITSTTTAQIVGGTLGQVYFVANVITTVNAKQTLQQNLQITVQNV